jgi:hypothetical protein
VVEAFNSLIGSRPAAHLCVVAAHKAELVQGRTSLSCRDSSARATDHCQHAPTNIRVRLTNELELADAAAAEHPAPAIQGEKLQERWREHRY